MRSGFLVGCNPHPVMPAMLPSCPSCAGMTTVSLMCGDFSFIQRGAADGRCQPAIDAPERVTLDPPESYPLALLAADPTVAPRAQEAGDAKGSRWCVADG